MQNCSCFTRKQTCNGEYTKHCTRSRHQLKTAAPTEVSEKRSNFRIRQFKEKRLFNIAANLTLNTMASFVILLIACTARIACSDRHTYIQTDRHTQTRDSYCNPLCACAPRVNNLNSLYTERDRIVNHYIRKRPRKHVILITRGNWRKCARKN